MWATVRRYEGVTNPDEAGKRVREGFVPLMSDHRGFVAYYWVDAGDGVMFSTSVFEDQADAEDSNALAAEWVKAKALIGCGGDEEESPGDGGATAPAVSSGVEGVPIPKGAEPIPSLPNAWQVPAMSFKELVAWYDDQLPEGQAFGGWAWCDTGGGAENPSRIYSQGAKRILAVTITADDPPGVLIGVDQSGPC